MRYLIIILLILLWSVSSVAEEKKSQWFLNYSKLGDKPKKIELDRSRYDFTNDLGQKCWVTATKRQPNPDGPDPEEREVICRIDSKNSVAISLACWAPYKGIKQRSFATSRVVAGEDSKEIKETAVIILGCKEASARSASEK